MVSEKGGCRPNLYIDTKKKPKGHVVDQKPIDYSFIPNILCTRRLCRMLRSSMISSLPPGMA